MKKIILILVMFLFIPFSYASDCSFSENGDLVGDLENCLSDTPLVSGPEDTNITGGLNDYILRWTSTISLYLGVFAVLGIATGSLMLVISSGQDDKITKGKNIIKWSIIGFILVLTAALIINVIIRIMYSGALNATSIILG